MPLPPFPSRLISRWCLLVLALLLPHRSPAQSGGKREVGLPEPGRFYSKAPAGTPIGLTFFRSLAEQARVLVDAYRTTYQPGSDGPAGPLYAAHFDALRHLELKAGTPDTATYALNYNTIYRLSRGPDRQILPKEVARLPFNSTAMCKGPNGDLYLANVDPGDARFLYRFDPRRKKLYRSNLQLPPLNDPTDWWLCGAAWNDCLYFLNKNGTNLVELAPGRVPRNLFADALRTDVPPGFVSAASNFTIGPDRTFYLKENFIPRLWTFTEKNGRLTVAPPIDIKWAGVTGSIALLPGGGVSPRLLLGERNDLNPQLVIYDLARDDARLVARLSCTDLVSNPVPKAEAAWGGPTVVKGWFRGALYTDYDDRGELALHFAAGGRIDSVALAGKLIGVQWHTRTRADRLEISADATFQDYAEWHGGGRVEGAGKDAVLTLALQSSVFDAIAEATESRLPFGYHAATEGFARLKFGPPPPKTNTLPQPTPAVQPEPVAVAPDTTQKDVVQVPPAPTPAKPKLTPAVVRDSLACGGADEITVEVSDWNVVDGDQVRFYLGEEPITAPIKLRKRPSRFHFPCPPPGTLLVMRTLKTGKGPCTARVVIRQGEQEKVYKLESTGKQASALRFGG